MLGTLPPEVKRNWQEYVFTLVHAYNHTRSHAIGFSPYFFCFLGDNHTSQLIEAQSKNS